MNKIYTAGYSGHTPEQLQSAAESLNAIVCDIRFSPRSRVPGWDGRALREMLDYGMYYRHVPEWGNINYKGGEIKLLDAPRGLLKILRLLESHSVILLCGCREYSHCHRRVCAGLLRERGLETQELEWPENSVGVGRVKTISLWQPWASLIAIGAKKVETRHWSTSHRGPLVIHAAKTKDGYDDIISHREENGERALRLRPPFGDVLRAAGYERLIELPLGALLCVVDLVDCVPTESLAAKISEQERAFGNYGSGRFGWILENVRVLPAPVPYRGAQGIFSVEENLLNLVPVQQRDLF
jgi:hypothetical protein